MADEKRQRQEAREEDERFRQTVARKERRRLDARRRAKGDVWFWIGMFGLVGWSVMVPTVLGALLGAWLDRRWPDRISWTLTLLFAGVVVGCATAWRWIRQESREE
jgi:ATP synthase protein I